MHIDSVEGIVSFDYYNEEGFIPYLEYYIGLPPDGEVEVSVEEGNFRTERYKLPGFSFFKPKTEGKRMEVLQKKVYSVTYSRMRGLKIAILRYFPYRYSSGYVTYPSVSSFRVEIKGKVEKGTPPTGVWDRIYRKLLLNYERARYYRRTAPQVNLPRYDGAERWIKVICKEEGIYEIRGEDVERAGWDIENLDVDRIGLRTVPVYDENGPYPDSLISVPIMVMDGGDGKLDKDDRIVFFAPGVDRHSTEKSERKNIYTCKEIFFLTYPDDSPLRMEIKHETGMDVVEGISGWNTFEEDSLNPAQGGTLWLWKRIDPGESGTLKFNIPKDMEIRGVEVEFYTDGSGVLDLYIDDDKVGEMDFKKNYTVYDPNVLKVELDSGYRSDRISLYNHKDGVSVYVDLVRLLLKGDPDGMNFVFSTDGGTVGCDEDEILLKVKDIFNPIRIEGEGGVKLDSSTYAISPMDKLKKPELYPFTPPSPPSKGYDMVIIVPEKFLGPGERWRAWREATFGSVGLFTKEYIYDLFYGIEEPGAIKEFIKYIYPTYVALGADVTYDMRGIIHEGVELEIPSYEKGRSVFLYPSVFESSRGYADDKWYVDFDEDKMYDAVIGRISARSSRELSLVVEKMKRYEKETLDEWMNRVILVADDEYMDGKYDPFGVQYVLEGCERAIDILPDGMEYIKVYSTYYPFHGNTKPEAREDFVKAINRGGVIGLYFGHGNNEQLAHESLFTLSDIKRLKNGVRLPFFIFATCGASWFERITTSSLGEDMVLNVEGGAIATLGAYKGTGEYSNEIFVRNVLEFLNESENKRIGDAFLYASNSSSAGYMYCLIGDPVTPIKLPGSKGFDMEVPSVFKEGNLHHTSLHNTFSDSVDYVMKFYIPMVKKSKVLDMYDPPYTLEIYFDQGVFAVKKGEIPPGVSDTLEFVPPLNVEKGDRAHVSFIYKLGDTLFVDGVDRINYDTSSTYYKDDEGPDVSLYINGVRIKNGMNVPKNFVLEGVCSDRSGVLLVPTETKRSIVFVGSMDNWMDISEYMKVGDDDRVHFKVPLSMEGDTLGVVVYDNLLNPTKMVFHLNVSMEHDFDIENILVYPNPVRGDFLYFTFHSPVGGICDIDIYTVSGRKIFSIRRKLVKYGFNRIEWDLRDRSGRVLDNGPYYYIIRVESNGKVKKYRGKFLVWR